MYILYVYHMYNLNYEVTIKFANPNLKL